LPAFLGEQDQIAPLFSAKSVDGVRAYELARKLHQQGKTLDEAAAELIRVSRINITELELMEYVGSASEPAIAVEDIAPPRRGWISAAGTVRGSSEATPAPTSNASSRINVTDNSSLGLPRAVVRMACSKGTYVRAFARDLGEALGTGAHLDSLQRSRSGIFRVENALTVDQAIHLLTGGAQSPVKQ
jgi:tRNA pseudouridine55 synthase